MFCQNMHSLLKRVVAGVLGTKDESATPLLHAQINLSWSNIHKQFYDLLKNKRVALTLIVKAPPAY